MLFPELAAMAVTIAVALAWRNAWAPAVGALLGVAAPKIVALNAMIRSYAARAGAVYLDYHSAMADEKGGMREGMSSDGVHPNTSGYRLMAPLAEEAIAEALRRTP